MASYKVLLKTGSTAEKKKSFHINSPQKVCTILEKVFRIRVQMTNPPTHHPYSISIKYLQQTMSSQAVVRFQAKGIS